MNPRMVGACAVLTLMLVSVAPADADPVVAAAGDIACGTGSTGLCAQASTADAVASITPDVVLPLGDEQYENGSLADFQSFYGPAWGRFKAITRPAPGNHEYGTSGAAGYYDYFNGAGVASGPAGDRSKGYYSFDLGGWHLVALNSNCDAVGGCSAGSPQETWLRNDLDTHPASCTLAYMHHPRWSSDSAAGNQTQVSPLVQALYDGRVDLMLAGHAHTYERYGPQSPAGALDTANGITEVIAGTGGKSEFAFSTIQANSLASSDTLGALKLTLHPSSYDLAFVPAAGQTFTDSSAGLCHGRSAPATSGPSAQTLGVNGVSRSGATLTGSVTANANPTTYHFEYGRTNSYGTATPDASAGSGTAAVAVSAPVSGLARQTTYHYRVVARWASGGTAAVGSDATFTTAKH